MPKTKNGTRKSSLAGAKRKHVVKEAVVTYVRRNKKSGGFSKSTQKLNSPLTTLEKMHFSRTGVTKEYLEKIKMQTRLDYTKLAKLLSVTRATLINKKKQEKFNPSLSERIIGLASLYDYGFEVFEDRETFNHWMSSPNKALGGELPFDLIDNQFGREEVKHVLGRIEYGVYS
jgi:putative toxin-antitoxin system antitoxin component (TIGR02293 family)